MSEKWGVSAKNMVGTIGHVLMIVQRGVNQANKYETDINISEAQKHWKIAEMEKNNRQE